MGDALFDLEQVLRSKKEQLTLQEANILMVWKAEALRDFTIGWGGGAIVTWLATQRLHKLLRFNYTLVGGTAAACVSWKFGRSAESSIQRILSLEGSRIQIELANIMLKKYHDDPWALQHLSKHFYSEEVYDDSSVDRPILRWRLRNFSGDPTTHSQSTSYGEETDAKENDVKKTTMEPKQVYVNAAGDAMENPFDLIFGLPGSAENVPHPDTPGASSRRERHRDKRSHRRHRRHHQEESDN
ncbi:hypothetical protein Pfo_016061 [Paulownia fortunei]|nr:hypothetical protein Pfo_016061 [Paulownia fortunei]